MVIRARTVPGIFSPIEPPPPPPPTGEYDDIDNVTGYTDHWVDLARTTTGSGTFGDPYSFNQVMTLNRPTNERHRFTAIPGQLSVTTTFPGDSKMPAIQPTWGGSAANPVILRAQHPATRTGVSLSNMSIIRRTSGTGSIFGTGPTGPGHWKVDGFKFAGGHAAPGADGANENATIVLRGCTGWSLTRIHIDGEESDSSPQGSSNAAGIYIQGCTFLRLKDLIIENIGAHATNRIFQGIELYDTADSEFSYFTIRNCFGLGFFMKGFGVYAIHFQRNRVHHGIVSQCYDSAYHPYYVVAGTNTANHNYWYNLVADQRGMPQFNKCVLMNAIDPHQGTHFQNCAFIGGHEAVSFENTLWANPPHITFRNNCWHQSVEHIMYQDGHYGQNNSQLITFNYNQYGSRTGRFAAANVDINTFQQWQASPYLKDANGVESTPAFANFAGGDFRTIGPNVVPDHHGLFGPVGALIPFGPFQPYGCRRTL